MSDYDIQRLTKMRNLVVGLMVNDEVAVYGIVDTRGRIMAIRSVSMEGYPTPDRFVNDISDEIVKMAEEVGGMEYIKALGIGVASGNNVTGCVENASNLQWKGVFPMASMFKDRLGIGVALGNDVTVSAIGESMYGAARGMHDFLCLSIGGGLGGGLVVNGQVALGYCGRVGEIGHVQAFANGRRCTCGNIGCLESYVSTRGILDSVAQILEENPNVASQLRAIGRQEMTLADVRNALDSGDDVARQAIDITGALLGRELTSWVALTGMEAVILTGPVADMFGNELVEASLESMNTLLLRAMRNKTKVLLSNLHGEEAALLYASAYAWSAKEYNILL